MSRDTNGFERAKAYDSAQETLTELECCSYSCNETVFRRVVVHGLIAIIRLLLTR